MDLRDYKRYPITVSLIAICVIYYVMTTLRFGFSMNAYEALEAGAYNGYVVSQGHAYWRLLTANFIHFSILHIVMNCYSLYGLGAFIERVLGRGRYLAVIIISALCTNGLPYLLFNLNGFESNMVSGGISGVIFGVIGALAALAIVYNDIFMSIWRSLVPNLVFMFIISFIVPNISLSGHASGFIGGFISAYLLLRWQKRPARSSI